MVLKMVPHVLKIATKSPILSRFVSPINREMLSRKLRQNCRNCQIISAIFFQTSGDHKQSLDLESEDGECPQFSGGNPSCGNTYRCCYDGRHRCRGSTLCRRRCCCPGRRRCYHLKRSTTDFENDD